MSVKSGPLLHAGTAGGFKMTVLQIFKQRLKNLYGRYEMYLLPVIKFAVALVFFMWINAKFGYMAQLKNIYILLIAALICSILPTGVTVFMGFVMLLIHSYAICLEALIMMLVVELFLAILFLRFSNGQNMSLVCTPLAFSLGVPALLPIGSGLMGNAMTIFSASSGVIVYYFISILNSNAAVLQNRDIQVIDKVRAVVDTLITNWAMWLTILAFVLVILLVFIIRKCSFDYARSVAIIAGGFLYILVMLVGEMYAEVSVSMETLLTQTGISVAIALVVEFFFFSGDYKRAERLQYEDDDYYYYVKAVPKVSLTVPDRRVKKITRRREDESGRSMSERYDREPYRERGTLNRNDGPENVDFEKKLEESLKDL